MSCVALRVAKRIQLFAHDSEEESSPVRSASVLEKENTLPGAELHFSVHNRYGLAGAGKNHANV